MRNLLGARLAPGNLACQPAREIGDVVAAWVETDREAGAPALREALLAARQPAREEQETLLQIEDALEVGVRARLGGTSGGPDPRAALQQIKERAGL